VRLSSMSNESLMSANRTGRKSFFLVMNGEVLYHRGRAADEEFSLALNLGTRYAYKFVSRKVKASEPFFSTRET